MIRKPTAPPAADDKKPKPIYRKLTPEEIEELRQDQRDALSEGRKILAARRKLGGADSQKC